MPRHGCIGGICDRFQRLCFAPAFWNGRDDHLKERLFGLTPYEGNHGEDVKECYYHVDNTPTHSFMSLLYRYPQRAFPYAELVAENRRRERRGPEYELTATGIFDDGRFFDILVEYAKRSPEEIAIRITATNRGGEPAELHIVPTLWFRNTWAWDGRGAVPPSIRRGDVGDIACLVADDTGFEIDPRIPASARLGPRWLVAATPPRPDVLFTDNETNGPVVFGPGHSSRSLFTKDAFHRRICAGVETACNAAGIGTKAAFHHRFVVPPGGSVAVRLLLADRPPQGQARDLEATIDDLIERRRRESDLFHEGVAPRGATDDEKHVQRRALAGLLWTNGSCSGGRWRACSGRSRTTSSTSHSGSTATIRPRRRRRAVARSATPTGGTSTPCGS